MKSDQSAYTVSKYANELSGNGTCMKRICGLIFFWTGIGMMIMMFVPVCVGSIFVMLLLLLAGYNLFCW